MNETYILEAKANDEIHEQSLFVKNDNKYQILKCKRELLYILELRDNVMQRLGGEESYMNSDHGRALDFNLSM